MDDDADDRRVVNISAFRGPLPPPEALAAYDDVEPGLAREIVDQWKAETAHRHETVDGLRRTDHEAMQAFFAGMRRGQVFGLVAVALTLGVAALAFVLKQSLAGFGVVVFGAAAAAWSMRRSPESPPEPSVPADLGDGDALLLPGDLDPPDSSS